MKYCYSFAGLLSNYVDLTESLQTCIFIIILNNTYLIMVQYICFGYFRLTGKLNLDIIIHKTGYNNMGIYYFHVCK